MGIGGNSSVDIVISDQLSPERNIYGDNDRDQYFRTGVGMMGLTHTQPPLPKPISGLPTVSRDRQNSDHDYVTRDLLIQEGDTTYTNVNLAFNDIPIVKDRVALAVHANHKISPEKDCNIEVWIEC